MPGLAVCAIVCCLAAQTVFESARLVCQTTKGTNQKCDDALARAVSGKGSQGVAQDCTSLLHLEWDLPMDVGEDASVPALEDYCDSSKDNVKLAGVDGRCFQVLDVWGKTR